MTSKLLRKHGEIWRNMKKTWSYVKNSKPVDRWSCKTTMPEMLCSAPVGLKKSHCNSKSPICRAPGIRLPQASERWMISYYYCTAKPFSCPRNKKGTSKLSPVLPHCHIYIYIYFKENSSLFWENKAKQKLFHRYTNKNWYKGLKSISCQNPNILGSLYSHTMDSSLDSSYFSDSAVKRTLFLQLCWLNTGKSEVVGMLSGITHLHKQSLHMIDSNPA